MQLCEVYLHSGSIYIVSQSFDEFGIGLSIGPMFKVSCNDPVEIGNALISALDASRSEVQSPADFKAVQKDLYRFLDVKSWGELVRKARCVSVKRESSRILMTPQRVGESASFMPDGPGMECASCDTMHIGQALSNIIGLEKSETVGW